MGVATSRGSSASLPKVLLKGHQISRNTIMYCGYTLCGHHCSWNKLVWLYWAPLSTVVLVVGYLPFTRQSQAGLGSSQSPRASRNMTAFLRAGNESTASTQHVSFYFGRVDHVHTHDHKITTLRTSILHGSFGESSHFGNDDYPNDPNSFRSKNDQQKPLRWEDSPQKTHPNDYPTVPCHLLALPCALHGGTTAVRDRRGSSRRVTWFGPSPLWRHHACRTRLERCRPASRWWG